MAVQVGDRFGKWVVTDIACPERRSVITLYCDRKAGGCGCRKTTQLSYVAHGRIPSCAGCKPPTGHRVTR